MFRKRPLTNSGTPGSNPDPGRSKRQRVADGMKILLDIAKESSDCFPFLKSALGFVNALIKHYEHCKDVREKVEDLVPLLGWFKQNIAATASGGDQAENQRRSEFSSKLEDIEKRSRALLEKGVAARFVDKGNDSAEVTRLIEQLRDAITHYQISQQQAIYDRIANLTSSFDILLKLHEKSPVVKNKLDSVMARLDRLCSEDDGNDALCDGTEHERRAGLFSALRLIRDNGNALYNRINAQGYEECPGDIAAVSGMAEDIRDALLEYQTTQQRAMYDYECRLITAADLLVLNSCRRAPGAGYRHGERKGCLRGTRETVLNEIESWSKDFNKPPVFWLNGLAGTGKTTIAQTVSEWAFADGLLGASFFCSRDFADRSDLHFIFPTLAFQLAHKYPTFRSILVTLLQSDPDVAHESLCGQMTKLIVEPLRSTDVSTVIVIDALDECKDDEPSSAILSVLGRFFRQIPRVKFFITGRPEPRIKTGFRLPLLVDSTDVFVLHDVHPALINDDIRLFLKHELSELARRRQIEGWPSDDHVDLLCHRAAGLFVYAAATVKFLDAKAQLPRGRLDAIADLPECTDHEGKTRFNSNMTLDSLYTSILETAFGEEDPEILPKVRSTIGAVVLFSNPLPPSGIAELIGLDPEEVILFLTLVHSLLAIDEDFSQPVKPFHKSFPDFITDPLRCADTRFYISPDSMHFELVTNCLRVMNEGLEQNLLSLPDYALNSEVKDLETRIDNRISIALRYACQSWHGHLTKTVSDANGIVSLLRDFLEEKFLAWLEVLSVLGAIKAAVVTLDRVIHWLQQVAKNVELLDTARDCLHFVTRFFDPISISAAHIYHSALELSPFSSIVRGLYHHRRCVRYPRVVAGIADLWDQSLRISGASNYESCAWSPCGQFVATVSHRGVDIRDALSSELVFAFKFTESRIYTFCAPAYSPDGRSIAYFSETLTILDTQTGGVTKIGLYNTIRDWSIVWSLDGGALAAIHLHGGGGYGVRVCDVASGTIRFLDPLQSSDEPHLWAHNRSFRIMATGPKSPGIVTIEIFEVEFDLTKIESFQIHVDRWEPRVGSFSPTTYRISTWDYDGLCISDKWNSKRLSKDETKFNSHIFSSDGSLFAASTPSQICIWKYDSGCYTLWRDFPIEFPLGTVQGSPLQFSPTSLSIMRCSKGFLRVFRLDGPPIVVHPRRYTPLAVLSPCGTYMATAHELKRTVTITNLLSQTTSQSVDTDMKISWLALTGNVLLVFDEEVIAAWRLTEEGLVDGVCAGRRAGCGNRIWAVSAHVPGFEVEGRTVTIASNNGIHPYDTGTGEVLEPTQAPTLYGFSYGLQDMYVGRHYLHYHSLGWEEVPSNDNWQVSPSTLREGWVKDPEGKHRLWIPFEWRDLDNSGWLSNIKTLWLNSLFIKDSAVIIMF